MNSDRSPLENKVLLVVDDDPQNRTSVLEIIRNDAPTMVVLMAAHGQQGLDILLQKKVDVILLDWEMPVMNGLEFLEFLQTHKKWSELPVVMYTGAMTTSQSLQTAFEKGAIDFLRKPADPIEIIARLRSVLYQKQMEKDRLMIKKQLSEAELKLVEKEKDVLKKELNSYLLLLVRKNEALMAVKKQFEDALKSDLPTFNQIAQQINQLITEDKDWNGFMQKFNKTDPFFIQKILGKENCLSNTELKICTLIRFGMSNKEIMHLFNISSEGIKKSRYRIRKKLNLEKGASLEKYILSV